MKKLWSLLIFCLLLTGCGADSPSESPPKEPPAGTEPPVIFTYNGKEYDLQEREASVNALMGETPVGNILVVEGHISPKVAYYGIFDTETERFLKDILGTHLTWRDDDITTAVYDLWSESTIYSYDGQALAKLELAEDEYVYSLTWADSRHLRVEILSDSSEAPRLLELEIPA